jgi:CRISPR-associated protein Csc1
MQLYPCELTFHDNLFYETRTLGRLYETGRLLHNIALCYALGFAQTTYRREGEWRDKPSYAQELAAHNDAGVYVTPAAGLDVRYAIHTFKYGDERAYTMMEKSNENLPTFGRAKEVAVGSRFAFAVLAARAPTFPRWIRMGLWMSKARLDVGEAIELHYAAGARTETVSHYPLNPADLPPTAMLDVFDLVSMRPTNLVENALISADAWWTGTLSNGKSIWLPAGLRHNVGG